MAGKINKNAQNKCLEGSWKGFPEQVPSPREDPGKGSQKRFPEGGTDLFREPFPGTFPVLGTCESRPEKALINRKYYQLAEKVILISRK